MFIIKGKRLIIKKTKSGKQPLLSTYMHVCRLSKKGVSFACLQQSAQRVNLRLSQSALR